MSQKYTYDGLDVVLDDSNGTLTKYQNGPGIDDKLKSVSGTTTKYFLDDMLGSSVKLVNAGLFGGVSDSNTYDSFGNRTNTSFPSRYQYTGREWDTTTGLQYSRARWYDPQIGRFISEDPIGFGGGDVNLYAYVWNDPLGFYDPSGLDGFKLPNNPGPNGSNLPKGWRPDNGHKYPNGERWVSPNGDEGLDFHRGRPNQPGMRGKDHWHKLKPGRGGDLEPVESGGRKGGHYLPDDEVDLDSAKFCPARIPGLGQPSPEEIRLQIDAANNMEEFWRDILLGSAAGGAIYLGGPALIPAAIPYIPYLEPRLSH